MLSPLTQSVSRLYSLPLLSVVSSLLKESQGLTVYFWQISPLYTITERGQIWWIEYGEVKHGGYTRLQMWVESCFEKMDAKMDASVHYTF